jgi:signal transduction protein with GAF and PtsI domain
MDIIAMILQMETGIPEIKGAIHLIHHAGHVTLQPTQMMKDCVNLGAVLQVNVMKKQPAF